MPPTLQSLCLILGVLVSLQVFKRRTLAERGLPYNLRSSKFLTTLGWFWWFPDLPVVLPLPQQLCLPKGMLGRIDCLAESNPPVYLTVWSKNERVIDLTQTTRFKVNVLGTLVIKTVTTSDEGRYTCTPYSPLGPGQTSSPVQVLVRGKSSTTPFI